MHIPLAENVVPCIFHEDTVLDWNPLKMWLLAAC